MPGWAGGVAQGPTLLLLVASFLRSPRAAMLAKYWMTLLVLTVFPAPDSPLGAGEDTRRRWRTSWRLLQPSTAHPTTLGQGCGGGDLRDEDGLVLTVWKEEKGVR